MKRMLFVTLLLLSIPSVSLAAESPSLGQLIADMYSYSLTIVGICVFMVILYAGVQLMFFGNRDQAYDIIKHAVIGTILLYSAVVILNTINPDLTHGTTYLPSLDSSSH